MFGLGIWELVVILAIVVLLFGTSRLPQLGKGLGEGISNFKRGLKGDEKRHLPEPEDDDEQE
jgi:sec-independent protein translocase protein TatA